MDELAKKQMNTQKMQCPECGFIYDPLEGDPESNIDRYTNFEDITDWSCPICDGLKEAFIPYMPKKQANS